MPVAADLEAAVKAHLLASAPVVAAFGSQIYADRKPVGQTEASYLIFKIPSMPVEKTSSTLDIYKGKILFTAYDKDKDVANAKSQVVFEAVNEAQFIHAAGFTEWSGLRLLNRVPGEAGLMSAGVQPSYSCRLEFQCREYRSR